MTHTHKLGKNKRFAKLISLVVVCALALVTLPSFVYAADTPVAASGVNGGCVWEKAEDGTLTVKVKDGESGQLNDLDFVREIDGNGNKNRLTKIVFEKGVKAPENMYQAFYGCKYVTEIQMNDLDTSKTTNMAEMFKNCGSLVSTKVKDIDTSNVTDMHEMFYGCKSLQKSLPSHWNTAKVTNVNSMYMGCSSLEKVNFATKWTFENVVDMGHMFDGCNNLKSVGFTSKLNTSNVKDMSYLFNDCDSLTTIGNFDKFNTDSVENMDHMFNHCLSMKSINVRNWNTSNVTDMSNMFAMCSNLHYVFFGDGFDTSNVNSMAYMFYRDAKLTGLNVSKFNTSNVKYMTEMFNGCSNAKNLNVSNWDTAKCVDTKLMFANCTNLSELDLGKWNLKAAQANDNHYDSMFEGCKLKAINIGLDIPKAEAFVVTPGDPFGGAAASRNGQKSSGLAIWMTDPKDRYGIWAVEGYTPSEQLMKNEAEGPKAPAADAYVAKQGSDLKVTLIKVTNGDTVLQANDAISTADGINTINGDLDFSKDIVVLGNVEGPAGLDNSLTSFKKLNGVVVVDEAGNVVSNGVVAETTGVCTAGGNTADRQFTASIKGGTLEAGKTYTLKFESKFATCSISDDPYGYGYGETHSLGSDVLFNFGSKNTEPEVVVPEVVEPEAVVETHLIPNSTVEVVWNEADGSLVLRPSPNAKTPKIWVDGELLMKDLAQYKTRAKSVVISSPMLVSGPLDNHIKAGANDPGQGLFDGFKLLESADVSNLDLMTCGGTGWMFRNCENLKTVKIGNMNTGNVQFMVGMFENCKSLESLDLSELDTSSVQNMGWMFANCKNLKSLDLSSFNTAKVRNMRGMFAECESLESLNTSSFNTEAVVSMRSMFQNCSSLKQLDLKNFSTPSLRSAYSMFLGCSNVEFLDLSNFDTSHMDIHHAEMSGMDSMFGSKSSDLDLQMKSLKSFVLGPKVSFTHPADKFNAGNPFHGAQVAWHNGVKVDLATSPIADFNPLSQIADVAGTWIIDPAMAPKEEAQVETPATTDESAQTEQTTSESGTQTDVNATTDGSTQTETPATSETGAQTDTTTTETGAQTETPATAETGAQTDATTTETGAQTEVPATAETGTQTDVVTTDTAAQTEEVATADSSAQTEVPATSASTQTETVATETSSVQTTPEVAVLNNNLEPDGFIRFDYDLDKFRTDAQVFLDGKLLVENKDYILTKGSTIVTLMDEKVVTLPDAMHKLTVNFKNGATVDTAFKTDVNDKNNIAAKAKARLAAKQSGKTVDSADANNVSKKGSVPSTGDFVTIATATMSIVAGAGAIAVSRRK